VTTRRRHYLPWLVIATLAGGCGGNTVASDQAYADQLIASELRPPMTFQEVRAVLARHDSDAVLQDGCGLGGSEQASCAYSTVALIALPNNHWWRGQGDVQISMIFDAQERLLSVKYELSYPGDS
jgi:hypothetical protein